MNYTDLKYFAKYIKNERNYKKQYLNKILVNVCLICFIIIVLIFIYCELTIISYKIDFIHQKNLYIERNCLRLIFIGLVICLLVSIKLTIDNYIKLYKKIS